MRLILVRHGQAQWQTGVSASLDSPLTELGKRQAFYLGEWACHELSPAPLIWSSPLVRARATAQAIGARVRVSVRVDVDLREAPFHVGSLLPKGNDPCEIVSEREEPERLRSFTASVRRALGRLCAETAPSGEIVCVCHSGVIETSLRTITGSANVRFELDNGSLTTLDWEGGRWHLRRLNCVDHLPHDARSN